MKKKHKLPDNSYEYYDKSSSINTDKLFCLIREKNMARQNKLGYCLFP